MRATNIRAPLPLYTNELSLFKARPVGQIVSVPRAHALATKMMFWAVARAGLVLELQKSLAVTKKKFMVYDFNCSTLEHTKQILERSPRRNEIYFVGLWVICFIGKILNESNWNIRHPFLTL
jgi:hypothetical protein